MSFIEDNADCVTAQDDLNERLPRATLRLNPKRPHLICDILHCLDSSVLELCTAVRTQAQHISWAVCPCCTCSGHDIESFEVRRSVSLMKGHAANLAFPCIPFPQLGTSNFIFWLPSLDRYEGEPLLHVRLGLTLVMYLLLRTFSSEARVGNAAVGVERCVASMRHTAFRERLAK